MGLDSSTQKRHRPLGLMKLRYSAKTRSAWTGIKMTRHQGRMMLLLMTGTTSVKTVLPMTLMLQVLMFGSRPALGSRFVCALIQMAHLSCDFRQRDDSRGNPSMPRRLK